LSFFAIKEDEKETEKVEEKVLHFLEGFVNFNIFFILGGRQKRRREQGE